MWNSRVFHAQDPFLFSSVISCLSDLNCFLQFSWTEATMTSQAGLFWTHFPLTKMFLSLALPLSLLPLLLCPLHCSLPEKELKMVDSIKHLTDASWCFHGGWNHHGVIAVKMCSFRHKSLCIVHGWPPCHSCLIPLLQRNCFYGSVALVLRYSVQGLEEPREHFLSRSLNFHSLILTPSYCW